MQLKRAWLLSMKSINRGGGESRDWEAQSRNESKTEGWIYSSPHLHSDTKRQNKCKWESNPCKNQMIGLSSPKLVYVVVFNLHMKSVPYFHRADLFYQSFHAPWNTAVFKMTFSMCSWRLSGNQGLKSTFLTNADYMQTCKKKHMQYNHFKMKQLKGRWAESCPKLKYLDLIFDCAVDMVLSSTVGRSFGTF